MTRDSFLDREDEQSETYKVLDAYSYLMDIVNAIAVYEETGNADGSTGGIIYN
jgi:hypothetical protein